MSMQWRFCGPQHLAAQLMGRFLTDRNPMPALSDLLIAAPNNRTNHIQEAHIAIGHLICAIVEEWLCSPKL